MDPCIVETKYGAVKGECRDGVYIWRGIPYAAAPEGENRFRAPLPPNSWEGVRNAVEFGPSCPQGGRSRRRSVIRDMSEDCLSLNIWSPGKSTKKPVFFYIHGGTFIEGAGSDAEYEGTKLAGNGDIILITVNYRMGVLGFMDFSFLGEDFLPNCGLRDLALALRWVYENIEAFGGDKDNITVGGQSAGASCAVTLTMFDDVRPYIKRVIMMSGVPTLLFTREESQKIAKMYLKYMDIDNAESLKAVSAMSLASRQSEFAGHTRLGAAAFGICVDGELVKQFLIPAASEGKMSGISMLFGTTREEMSFALKKSLAHIVDIETVRKAGNAAESDEVKMQIYKTYERYGKRGEAIMFSDFSFRLPAMWFAEVQSKYADTWMYRFDYETIGMRITDLHAFHSCDVPFLFGNFKTGLAKYMVILSPVKIGIQKVYHEFQGDLFAFIKTGELPWEKCKGKDAPAKCYTLRSHVEQAVPDDVKEAYEATEYRRRSFSGNSIEL